jgi:hypothetical protein
LPTLFLRIDLRLTEAPPARAILLEIELAATRNRCAERETGFPSFDPHDR